MALLVARPLGVHLAHKRRPAMTFISKRNKRWEREKQQALDNRLELVKGGFTRRALISMGLMTGAGVLIPKVGLTHPSVGPPQYHSSSTQCDFGNSPQP